MSYVYQLAVAGAHPSYIVIKSHGCLILQQWHHIQWLVHNPFHLFTHILDFCTMRFYT